MKRIVVGIDLSSASTPALAQATTLAQTHGARLYIVHATGLTEGSQAAHDEAVRTAAPFRRFTEERIERAHQLLDAASQVAARAGIDVEQILCDGFAEATIVSRAHKVNADLIVVGTHGRVGSERWLLGSVAEQVVRLSERNVWVAREPTPPLGRPSRVLVATDFSETAERGIDIER